MADLLGFTSIAIVSFITLLIAFRCKDISIILYTALVFRIFVILIGHYIAPLPDSTADATTFERQAWIIGQDGFFNVIKLFSSPTLGEYQSPISGFISWFIAIPYSLFGRSILMAQSISMFFGIACVFVGWKLSTKIWDKRAARKVAWTIALFPSLVLYSVLVLREVYVSFFLLVAIYGVYDWAKTESLKSIIIAITGFLGATLFHGSMIVGAIIFTIIVGIIYLKKMLTSLINFRINFKKTIIFLIVLISLQSFISNKIEVTYLGHFKDATNLDYLIERTNISTRGDASWPEWTKIKTNLEFFYKAPLRSIYFVFSPFPWDVKNIKHLIGMFDAFFYTYMSYLILSNIKYIWKDPCLRIILLILLGYIFVFGLGVGNFGTGIRHRSKFVIIFILLSVPLIKKVIFFKKTK